MLKNKAQFLRDIFSSGEENEVTVAKKNELEAYEDKAKDVYDLIKTYPIYAAAVLAVLLFLMLFLMGGG